MYAREETAISIQPATQPPKVWKQFPDDVYPILKRTHLAKPL